MALLCASEKLNLEMMKLQGRNKISALVLYKESDEDVAPIINTTQLSHLFLASPLKSPVCRPHGANVSPVSSGSPVLDTHHPDHGW